MLEEKTSKTDIEKAIRISILDRLFDVKDMLDEVYKITTRNVFDNKWRVNVFMRGETTMVIPYSYLIEFSTEDGIISSIPDIVRNKATELNEPEQSKFQGCF